MTEPASFGTIFRNTLNDSTVDDSSPALVNASLDLQTQGPRYEVRGVLGRGGMGEVRLCRDTRIGRDVAIKVSHASHNAARARFLREVRVQGQLDHPAIVPVHDVELLPDGSAYFAMRRVRGVTLSAILSGLRRRDRDVVDRYPVRKLLSAFCSVCLAVEFAHARGVVHRDIKPGNIMLGDFGEVYLLDWGLAKLIAAADEATETIVEEPAISDEAQTRVGSVVGTPGYMAPEQIDADIASIGPATDVWALGAVLFEIVALEPYIDARDVTEAAILTLKHQPKSASRRVPAELAAVCTKALAIAPADRFPNARALHDAVDRWLAGEQDLARRREIAQQHVEAAQQRLGSADTPAMRALALQELGSAIALDPQHREARVKLLDLLTTPPRDEPPAVRARIIDDTAAQSREVAKLRALSQCAYIVFAPPAFFVGIHDPGLFLGSIGLIAISIAVNATIGFSKRPPRAVLEYLALVLALSGQLALARLAGPLMVIPALLVGFAVASQSHPDAVHRWWAIAGSVLTMAIVFLVEIFHIVEPIYTLGGTGLHVRESLMRLDHNALWYFFAVSIGTIVAPSLFVARTRAAQSQAERLLHIQRWQHEQLVTPQ